MLDAYSTYDSYKDSGVEWIGDVPAEWQLLRSKFIWREMSSISKDGSEQLLSVSQNNGVVPREEDSRSEDLTGYRLVQRGDLVSNIMLAWMGALGVSKYDGIVSPAYSVYRLQTEADTQFFDYLYKTDIYLAEFTRRSTGVVPSRWRLYTESFGEVLTLLPSLPEQRAIAAFLDEKCAKIDEAARIKEAQTGLLRERRQILIQHAVTRGLNPDAPMKDSGIDWIGQIPAHWEVRRGKNLFREVNERSEEGAEELLSVSHMTGVTSRSEKNVYMFMAEDYSGSKLCRPGDIVINTMWAWMGALGVSDLTGIISPSYGVYRPLQKNAFNRRFLEWLLRTTSFIEQYNRISTGLHSSRLRLYPHMFLGLPMAIPSRDEQDAIVAHIEDEAGKIDTAITIKQSQITTLKEYKTCLINAAVTGKIKVI